MDQALRGKSSTLPRLTLKVSRCDDAIFPGAPSVIATFPLEDLAAHLIVPVQRKVDETRLLQRTEPNWDRQLVANLDLGAPHFYPPVLLSSRNLWHLREDFMEVFDRAVVIDGANRLEAALHFQVKKMVPVMVVIGLGPAEELALRIRIRSGSTPTIRVEERVRFNTEAPRLKIEETWVAVEIQSDPFVVPTSRGFAPAIIVRRKKAPHVEHLLVGASSFAQPLEKIRVRYGTLKGRFVSVRKQGPERAASYDVKEG